MTWSVRPEPADEAERAALLRALEQMLADEAPTPSGYASRWWRAGIAELGGGPAPEEPRGEPGVVEP